MTEIIAHLQMDKSDYRPVQHIKKAQNDIPPAVAALLAVTAIPPKKTGTRPSMRRRQSSQSNLDRSDSRPKQSSHLRTKSTAVKPSDNLPSSSSRSSPGEEIQRPQSPRKSHSSKHKSSPRTKPRKLHSDLVELLTPPPVDDNDDSDDQGQQDDEIDGSREQQVYKIKSRWLTAVSPGSSSPPQLSSSLSSSGSSSPDSSPRSSPITPSSPSSPSEYFPIMDFEDSDESETSTLKSASSSATIQPKPSSSLSASVRHRKQRSESITMYNNDPLCVAVDENGACIPAIAFVPSQMSASTSPTESLLKPIQVRPSRSQSPQPRWKTNQEIIDEECERQHQSMVAKINSSIRSLKWIASSMARHQEEYMSKDEIDHLEKPARRSRSAERQHTPSAHTQHKTRSSSHNGASASKKRSSSMDRRNLRSESVPVLSSTGQEIRHRSLSAGGVTARSSARALTMQMPISERERQAVPVLSYNTPQTPPALKVGVKASVKAGVKAGVKTEATAEDGENAEVACIQMQTYDVQQNCLPIIRPREPRMNGDFLRILAMELQMRRHGKLSHDFYSGKARMVLAPRGDYGHLSKKTRNWAAWTA
ncbi:hypothetical protein V1512DRAFT_267549 [Lipomyces arxii]|uniref:uncharacterized protein n=1 Tax=Lipomyces arxii TaxID=56418 RepID=UPI0034CF271D